MHIQRRELLAGGAAGAALSVFTASPARAAQKASRELIIKQVRVTPIALPDPPLLAAGGCHGPYFLRNIVEVVTGDGVVGIGETHGGDQTTKKLRQAAAKMVGRSAFSYGAHAADMKALAASVYAGIELACLDAIGRAIGKRLCDLLGGAYRESIPFCSYLFFRYAADHPKLINDRRIVDNRGKGRRALDQWGEVRTPTAMAELAWQFHRRFGFTVHKLKAGVLPPDVEFEALVALSERFQHKQPVRIDPNGRWTNKTANRIGRKIANSKLKLEYYEDPVRGQEAMSMVRKETGLPTSTNSCVTRFAHIPGAVRHHPVDVVLCDHHYWGGFRGCLALAHMAPALGIQLSQHSNNHGGVTMAAMTHLAAVVPHLTAASDTHYPWLIDDADIIQGPNIKITNGQIRLPTRPGVGVDLDHDKLARAHEIYKKSGMMGRNDADTMRRIQPDWKRDLF